MVEPDSLSNRPLVRAFGESLDSIGSNGSSVTNWIFAMLFRLKGLRLVVSEASFKVVA